jgi:hypothetical protein
MLSFPFRLVPWDLPWVLWDHQSEQTFGFNKWKTGAGDRSFFVPSFMFHNLLTSCLSFSAHSHFHGIRNVILRKPSWGALISITVYCIMCISSWNLSSLKLCMHLIVTETKLIGPVYSSFQCMEQFLTYCWQSVIYVEWINKSYNDDQGWVSKSSSKLHSLIFLSN